MWFPINRRHQGLATHSKLGDFKGATISFQSIGVTKDWRRRRFGVKSDLRITFPINRRHQGLATPELVKQGIRGIKFPINRRHQGLATPAPTAVAAQGHPKAFARSPIMSLQTPVVYPVEILETLCAAIERAAPRRIGGSCLRQSCALR